MAFLAGGEIGGVEGQRIALREFRILPLVVGGKCANQLVVIQHRRQVGLVTGGAEFRRVVEVLHHRLGVPVEMRDDLRVRHHAGNAVALLIDHHRRHAHHKTAIAKFGCNALDGVAGRAGQAIFIELAVHLVEFWVERAGQNADRIVAAIAMPREFDALGAHAEC